jgi:hypothetical protein
MKKMGIKGIELAWFSSYLKDRQQFVQIEESRSELRAIRRGVPQGSILGPLLFLIYINDLPAVSKLIALLFADDTTLLASGTNLPDLIKFVNCEFKKICEYFRANKMALHAKKTQFMIFSHKTVTQNIEIFLDNNNENCQSIDTLRVPLASIHSNSINPAVRFLGVLIDPKLSFKPHVNQIKNKISRALFALRQVKNFLSQKALLALYYATIHCHLTYCLQAWGCANKSVINELVLKQKQAIRIVHNSNYNAHTEPLFKSSKVMPIHLLIQCSKIQFMHDFKYEELPAIFINTWKKKDEIREFNPINRELRNSETLVIPRFRTSLAETLPLCSFPAAWNNFDQEDLKFTRNKISFNQKIKKYFIESLSDDPNCSRANCPNCNPNRITV